jgi:hypothetical protein
VKKAMRNPVEALGNEDKRQKTKDKRQKIKDKSIEKSVITIK